MTTLHLLQVNDSLDRAIPSINPGDAVVYMHPVPSGQAMHRDIAAYYQLGDQGHAVALCIDYLQLVTLCTEYRHCLSW